MSEIIMDYLKTHAEFPILVLCWILAIYIFKKNIELHRQYNQHKKISCHKENKKRQEEDNEII